MNIGLDAASAAAASACWFWLLVLARHRRLWAVLLGPFLVLWTASVPTLTDCLVLAGVVLLLWRLTAHRSFDRVIRTRARRWRRRWSYRRAWPALVGGHRLTVERGQRPPIPRLLKIRCGPWADQLTVGMLTGQVPADFEAAAEGLAHATGCRSARVRVVSPGRLVIELAHADPLAAAIPALSAPASVPLEEVAIGICEDGSPWRLRVLGSHVLVAGVTGSGKGSVLWSLLAGLGPAIRSGVVSVWAVDPKGGMELGPGRPLFARFAAEDFDEMAELFDEAVVLMRERARRLAGITRLHEPTPEEPLVLVLVDELANLTAYLPDGKLRERITQSLSLLLTQGRAVGVTVVVALQDPRKDVVTFRNLFPAKVALRLDERTHVDMVLGDGSRAMGAYADRIPDSQPGLGYVRIDGVREPVRVRAAYVTDDDIARLAARYSAPTASRDTESSAA